MAMADSTIADTVNTDINIDEFKRYWIKKRESTATSPYGLHIGHYKSVVNDENILEVHRKLLLIPFQYAFVPQRWAQTVQIMLEKDSGKPWTTRLRIIELFDAQVNCGLKIIFGKRMVDNALKRGHIHTSAYGSVPKRTAQDAVMEKVISLDIMRTTRKCGAIFDCDAKGCYDRIIPALQTITCCRLGVPRSTSMFFPRFWNKCKHYVRTRHGISRKYYMSTGMELLYGIGQENGAGPAFWLSNLIIMFAVLDIISTGMQFTTPNGNEKSKSTGMGFVDDVTLGCTSDQGRIDNDEIKAESNQNERQVVQKITRMAQDWERMLHTNGGLLEFRKCYWILIAWRWVNGVAVMKKLVENEADLTIKTSHNNETVTITRKSTQDAPKVLGCLVAANGSWTHELGKWKAAARRFAMKVKNAHFNRTCGSKVYQSIWVAKLRYISPVVCFTESESQSIDSPVVTQCLRAAGFNKNFPRAVVFGPKAYGGMQWVSCHSMQVVEKLKFFIIHVRRMDKIGKLLQILTETVQLSAGLCTPVLETRIKWQCWTEKTWLSNLKQGLDQINGKLITTFSKMNKQRPHDRAIMKVLSTWNISKKDMEAINRCRIYLQVLFISDISDYHGKFIIEDAVNVIQFRYSTLGWPQQVRPNKKDRNTWAKYIVKLGHGDGNLITTLGRWTGKSHQLWKYMLDEEKMYLLRTIDGHQKKHRRMGNVTYEKEGRHMLEVESGVPTKCCSIPVGYRADDGRYGIWKTNKSKPIFENDELQLTKTIGFVTCRNKNTVEEKWKKGSDWDVGTDGGLKDNVGTSGVVIYEKDKDDEICTAKSAEECTLKSLDSTREELRANLAAEILLNQFNEAYGNSSQQTVNYVCDSKSALMKLGADTTKQKIIDPLEAEADILMEIEKLRKINSNINRQFNWVGSHQNNKFISRHEMINNRADALATESRHNTAEGLLTAGPKYFYTGARVALTINDCVVSKNVTAEITKALYEKNIFKYYETKYHWSQNLIKRIDWNSFGKSLESHQGLHLVTILKLVHFWQPCNYYIQRNERRAKKYAKCSECEKDDVQFHYMSCASQYFVQSRKFAWKEFHTNMKKYKGEESFFQAIWIGIQNFVYNDFEGTIPRFDDITITQHQILVDAYEEQNLIGWDHFLVGRLSLKWGQFYKTRITNDGKTEGRVIAFTRKVVQSIWKYTLHVWKRHNDANHGGDKKYSTRDIKTLQDCVVKIYEIAKGQVSTEDAWLFREEAKIKITKPASHLVGWLERVLLCFEENVCASTKLVIKRTEKALHRLCLSSIYQQQH